jgi:hypothetical protein
VSVDPTHDRPERLKAFADGFGAGPLDVPDRRVDIDRLSRRSGVPADQRARTTMLIGNAHRRWLRTSGLLPRPRT